MKKTTIRKIAMTTLAALLTLGYAASGIHAEEADTSATKVTEDNFSLKQIPINNATY